MKIRFTKKTIIISVIAVIIVGFAITRFLQREQTLSSADLADRLANSTVPVTIRDLKNTIYTSGNISAKKSMAILAETAGTVDEVLVTAGDLVSAGQVLAHLAVDDLLEQIEDKELSFLIDQNSYQQALLDAKQAYEDAKREFAEKEALYLVDAISRNEYSSAKESLAEAELELEINTDDNIPTTLEVKYLQFTQSEKAIKDLYEQMADATIKSPIDGTITAIAINESDYVSSKTQLFEVADLTSLEIQASIGEYEVNKLGVGMKATVTGEAFERVYSGTLSNIAAAATKSGTETVVSIVIDIDDETRELKPNFTADADIVIASAQGVLAVPLDAVRTDSNGQKVVQLKVGETITPIQVETGVADDLYVQIITDEIQEGDEVVSVTNMGTEAGTYQQGNGVFPGGGMIGGNRPAVGGR